MVRRHRTAVCSQKRPNPLQTRLRGPFLPHGCPSRTRRAARAQGVRAGASESIWRAPPSEGSHAQGFPTRVLGLNAWSTKQSPKSAHRPASPAAHPEMESERPEEPRVEFGSKSQILSSPGTQPDPEEGGPGRPDVQGTRSFRPRITHSLSASGLKPHVNGE